MARVSRPMKIITLRIDEEEKARLEQLAEAGDVTLSRALREGAALYLNDFQGRVHRARGGNATWYGIRRDKTGRALTKRSDPTSGESRRAASLRAALYDRGLLSIREAWEAGAKPSVVLSSLAHWLDLVGRVYVGQPNEIGWDWFLRDYCDGYQEREAREAFRRELEGSLVRGTTVNVPTVLGALEAGFLRLLDDAEHQEYVRRAVLPAWDILERTLVR
jgi:Ribbon-helix-helix protein, copG family